MTFEEAAIKVRCSAPWISLHRHYTGEPYVTLDGGFDLHELKRLIEIIESVEKK